MPHAIHVKPGDFEGKYRMLPSDDESYGTGDRTYQLDPGTHWLDTGAAVGSSTIVFSVNDQGKIQGLSPAESASVGGNDDEIHFTTQRVTIRPGDYVGKLEVSLAGSANPLDFANGRPKQLRTIVGQSFFVHNLGGLAGSVFYATLDDNDVLMVTNRRAAKARGKRLRLRTTAVSVIPRNNEVIKLSGLPDVSSTADVEAIRGLTLVLTTGDGSAIRVVPG